MWRIRNLKDKTKEKENALTYNFPIFIYLIVYTILYPAVFAYYYNHCWLSWNILKMPC